MEGTCCEDKTDNQSAHASKGIIHSHLNNNLSPFLVFLIVFAVIFQAYKSRRGAKKKFENGEEEYLGFKDLPAVKPTLPLNLIGNVPQLLPLTEFLNTAEKWSQEFGDVFTVTGLGQQFAVFNSGPLIQALMKSTDIGHSPKPVIIYGAMAPYIQNGVLVSRGQFWQGQRRILGRCQSFNNLRGYIEMLNRHGRKLVEDLEKLFEDGKSHTINKEITIAFLGVISELLTGTRQDGSPDLELYHHNFSIWKTLWIKRVMNPILLLPPVWMLHPNSKLNNQVTKTLVDFAKRRIREHKESRANAEDEHAFRSSLDDLVEAGVDQRQIIDEINTMMVGGHETGASVIHCFCFCMALNQDVQEKARKEIDDFFENPNHSQDGKVLSTDSVQNNLKYLERCIMEALRLFPPVFFMARTLESPLKFEHQNNWYVLPAGANVIVCPYILHRRDVYFPDPKKFDPDRFLPSESAKRHAYCHIPFSAGQRGCLGLKFAMIEMKILMAFLLRNFELRTKDRMEDIPLMPYTTLTPAKDYVFEFKKRFT